MLTLRRQLCGIDKHWFKCCLFADRVNVSFGCRNSAEYTSCAKFAHILHSKTSGTHPLCCGKLIVSTCAGLLFTTAPQRPVGFIACEYSVPDSASQGSKSPPFHILLWFLIPLSYLSGSVFLLLASVTSHSQSIAHSHTHNNNNNNQTFRTDWWSVVKLWG